VLFVPGGMSDLRNFDSSRDAIVRSYRYVSPTLRYFGSDPWPDNGANFSMATHVNDLAALIRQLNAGPVHFVGWSYSGSLGILLAVQHPDLAKSLFVYEQSNLASWVTDPTQLNAAAASRKATFGPAVVASKGGDQAGAVRIIMNGVNGGAGAFDALPAARGRCTSRTRARCPCSSWRPRRPPSPAPSSVRSRCPWQWRWANSRRCSSRCRRKQPATASRVRHTSSSRTRVITGP
jgi:pimeloyl-ACP methyl ester carboxylesterase